MVVTLLPFVSDGSSQVKKLVSFEMTLIPKTVVSTKSGHAYATNSVLSSGLWYKVGVTETGLYKLTYEDLVEMGFSASSVSSSLISVYGNGTGRLSEVCGTSRPDDLLELPVMMHDGGDGVFGAGDYLVFYAKSPHSVSFDTYARTFSHNYNIYSDYSYYFVNLSGVGMQKRVTTAEPVSASYSQTVTDYSDYRFYEVDKLNLEETGQEWFSDLFDVTTQRSYTIDFQQIKSEPAILTLVAASIPVASSSFAISVNGGSVGSLSIAPMSGAELRIEGSSFSFVPNSSSIGVTHD